ncbi:glycosyltransferase [Cryomorpha ignava]|uniref:Glycosyltransferase n=1 Tax=Cryomorpha ignava TaxID=101383 RepID=A0A7K3WSJ2_9FLAO|nr:glycosyltransferase family 2 protein [Cryomorpha ignava]NEN24041.1 glycosyltransferase [Cryomorpha ignava]
MKVSVITISYNAASTIEETIQSVVNQKYTNIEYILIDGASKDDTVNIIEKHKADIHKVISKPDNGVYDAMNKGVALATGDLIAILNADDAYANPDVIGNVVEAIQNSGADTCYGNLEYVDRLNTSKVKRLWISGAYRKEAFLNGWMPPHPAFFAKRKLYSDFGAFNTLLKTSADYELILRFLYRYNASAVYLNQVLVKMKTGGQSNASTKNRLKANAEDRLAWKLNGLKPGKLTLIKKPLRKLSQFWKR